MKKVFDIMEVPEEWRSKLSEYIAENFSIKVFDSIIDPYNQMDNRDEYSSVLIDLDRFAKMIVKDTLQTFSRQLLVHRIDQSNNPEFYKAAQDTLNNYGIEEWMI